MSRKMVPSSSRIGICSCLFRSIPTTSIRRFHSPTMVEESINDDTFTNIKGKNVVRHDNIDFDGTKKNLVEKVFPEYKPLASTSAIPYSPPTHYPKTSSLLQNLRQVDTVSLNLPASSIIAHMKQHQESWFDEDTSTAPTPPPLIKLDPIPHQPNPHSFSAFLLQMAFLGASALGLIKDKKSRGNDFTRSNATRVKRAQRRARQLGEDEEVISINLLLTMYSPIKNPTEAGNKMPIQLPSPELLLRPVTDLLSQLADKTPNRWTIAAVLAFATSSLPSTAAKMQPTHLYSSAAESSRYELAQPILVLWAWRAYLPLLVKLQSQPLPELDHHIIKYFLAYLGTSATYKEALVGSQEIINDIAAFFFPLPSSNTTSPSTLTHSSTSLTTIHSTPPFRADKLFLTNFASTCVRLNRVDLIFDLLDASSPLSSYSRLSLVVETLQAMARDLSGIEEPRVARRIAKLFLEIVKDSIPSKLRRYNRLNPLPSIDPKIIRLVERGVKLLLIDLRSSLALQSIASEVLHVVAQTVRKVIRSSRTLQIFSEGFILKVIYQFVKSRHSRKALAVFNSIPFHLRSLSHHNLILRSVHPETSDTVWESLLSHPTLVPNIESFEARLTSHSNYHNLNLSAARRDLVLMRYRYKLKQTLRMKNKVLKILVSMGSEKQVRRYWSKLISDRETPVDQVSFNTMLGYEIRGEGGRGRKGLKQLKGLKIAILKRTERVGALQGNQGEKETLVTRNIALKVMTRWKAEVQVKDLVRYTQNILGVDLTKEVEEDEKAVVVVERKGWKERDIAMTTLVKAFGNRGEIQMKRRLVIIRARERKLIRNDRYRRRL